MSYWADWIILAMCAVLLFAGCALAVLAGYGWLLVLYLIILMGLSYRAWRVGESK